MPEILKDIFFDYTLRTVAIGAAVLGIVSGALGSFAVLRKQSLLGDAISHAALPGIALAFLITHQKTPIILLLGAAIAGWLGTLFMMAVIRATRIKIDSAMGMILSVFFGVGLVLLTFIQKLPNANQAGLDTFLFGQASALLERDVITMSILGAVAIVATALFWKEFKLLSFDPDFGASLGYPIWALDIILTTLLVIAIVIGLQTVGVVLMSAMVVAPAAAARQWTDKLGLMVLLAGVFGALAGISGAVISSLTPGIPTGPMIVLCISAIVAFSIFLAPNRGLFFRWLRRKASGRKLKTQIILSNLFELSQQHDSPHHPHSEAVLNTMNRMGGDVSHGLKELAGKGLVAKRDSENWALTETGYEEARRLVEEQL